MGKQTTTGNQVSRVVWDNLEEWVRKKVQEFIQSLLEEEIVAAAGSGWFSGLSKRLRQAAEADVGLQDHHTAPTQGEGTGGAF